MTIKISPVDLIALRCDQSFRLIYYCLKNPRFHSFRHRTHWHTIASHRTVAFCGSFLDPMPNVAPCMCLRNQHFLCTFSRHRTTLECLNHEPVSHDLQLYGDDPPRHRQILLMSPIQTYDFGVSNRDTAFCETTPSHPRFVTYRRHRSFPFSFKIYI